MKMIDLKASLLAEAHKIFESKVEDIVNSEMPLRELAGVISLSNSCAPSEGSMVSSRLLLLAEAYKSFKRKYPGRGARVPREVKDEAHDLCSCGVSVNEIARVRGLSSASVLHWFAPKKGKAAVQAIPTTLPLNIEQKDWQTFFDRNL